MATITRQLISAYYYVNDDISDPRTKDWFLIGTPWLVIALLNFYLYFVYTLGPRLMANRPPFKLVRLIQIYNVVQIVLSSYLLYKALELGWLRDYKFACQPVDYSNDPRALEIASVVWVYFIVKVVDLLDTVFFVLRKKQNQVTFLHVYHHAGMVFGSWAAAKYMAGGHVTFLGLVNSFVHVIMYCHYFATSLNVERPWWKKYVTQLQLLQFFILFIQYTALLWAENCGFPKWPALVMIPQNLFMTVLFGDFYYKTYVRKSKSEARENRAIFKETNGKSKDT